MLYTVKEAAQVLKTNVHYVYSLINKGLLPALKLGSWKIRQEALEDFLKRYEGFDMTNVEEITKVQMTGHEQDQGTPQ